MRPSERVQLPSAGFPTTVWSRLGPAAAPSAADAERESARRAALEDLARRYQAPAEAFLRASLARDADEARELFQAFFVHLLESDLLRRADPARGRFRAFFKVALRHFATDEHRRRAAAKRGGGARPAPLDEALALTDARPEDPEAELDRAWRGGLIEAALERTRATFEASGRGAQFAVFRDYYLAEDELDYRALAARHGVTTTDVSNYLMRAKRAWREELRRAVLDTVSNPADLDDELRWLVEEPAR